MICPSEFSKKYSSLFNNDNNSLKCDKNIIKLLFDTLNKFYKKINNSNTHYDIYKIQETELSYIDAYYFPLCIQESIHKNMRYIYNCKTNINHSYVNINIVSKNIHKKLESYILLIILWIHILQTFSEPMCNKNLDIFIYLSDDEKIVPHNEPIKTKHVNSGYTRPGCNETNSIVVYRKEEWFKVLAHECIHAFNLDFSVKDNNYLNQKLNYLFPLNFPFNAFEAYCETWAVLWNTIFYTYFENKKSFNIFYNKFIENINRECKFTNYQCNKVLRILNLNYVDLLNSNTNYKEETNVFSYYFLKRILLDNIEDFLHMCNNFNTYSIMKFGDNAYEPFFDIIQTNYNNYRDYEYEQYGNVDKSMRMTLLDFY